MELLIGWVVLSVVVGVLASSRNRSGGGYFLLSMVLSPLIGLLLVVLLPARPSAAEQAAQVEAERERMRCTRCAELVLAEALRCKHCGADLNAQRHETAAQAARQQLLLSTHERQHRAARAAAGARFGAAVARLLRRTIR